MSPFKNIPEVGIDDMSVFIPALYVDINDFAEKRNIEAAKLQKGLGLNAIAVPDASEDSITMAAEALLNLITKNNLLPADIGRIYVGTESMVDGSKPNASYLLGILKQYYDKHSISTRLLNRVDVVDMTFACIGAVDAMQNSLDWVRLNPASKAIVIATDVAKYELLSPGECTQGAGAVAVLISSDPRMVEISSNWGISAQCEHDFFKPIRRRVKYEDIVASNGVDESLLGREIYSEHKDTPVYDGHFSNECYTSRVKEAFAHFSSLEDSSILSLEKWSSLVFHLPYAYHARRIFITLYIDYLKEKGEWEAISQKLMEDIVDDDPKYNKILIKAASKTNAYKNFVREKIEPGERASSEVGNMYTGSIFLSLISTLSSNTDEDLTNNQIGFFAYGSGSKAKVFEGRVKAGYKDAIEHINIFEMLNNRSAINMDHYEYLHRQKLLYNLDSKNRKVFQVSSGWTDTNKFARNYKIVN